MLFTAYLVLKYNQFNKWGWGYSLSAGLLASGVTSAARLAALNSAQAGIAHDKML
jgi:hypothetical protein